MRLGKKKHAEEAKPEGEAAAEKPAESKEGAEGAEGAAAEEGGKGGKKKLIIIIAAVVVLLIAGGAGAYFMGMFGKHEAGEAKSEASAEAGAANPEGAPVFFDMPQLLVNLNTGGKQVSFIKTTVTLELEKSTDVAVVQANMPLLVDNYNTFLREMRSSDLYGSAGVYRLREEMMARANKILAPVKVKDVLFKELVVQ